MNFIFILKLLGTVCFGTLLGFVSSIPVGAVQLEVIKKTINGHTKPAIATAAGSATSDLMYGILALFGFGHFLLMKDFQIAIYSLGIAVLSFLVYKSFREREYMMHSECQVVYKKRLSFLTGFTISVSNPGMIIWWFVGFKLFLDLKMFDVVTIPVKLLFVFSGAFGLGLYLTLEALILHKFQKSFSERFLFRANMVLMSILAVLILYFIFKLSGIILGFNTDLLQN